LFRRFQIADLLEPVRADQFLADRPDMPSRSRLKRLFDDGLVRVNGRPAKPSVKLKNGDAVEVELPPAAPAELPAEPIPLDIIYQDRDLCVFDKPAGLLTHPTPNCRTGTLVNALLHHCHGLSGIGGQIKPGIVHRLDKLTSGVMVAAKTDAAHHGLAAQFKAHTIDRRYLALVHGEMENLSGRIESLIGRNPTHRLKMTGEAVRGRRAVTRYRVLARGHGFSLLECKLETGRTHQIRVHLSENRHPVVNDQLYGKGRGYPAGLSPPAHAALRHLKRQALHAYRLVFLHPVTGERMAFESPLPPDIGAVARALGLLEGLKLPERTRRVEEEQKIFNAEPRRKTEKTEEKKR
jgi:23S rRNA pseudouridine1911/1915/1917 synthase